MTETGDSKAQRHAGFHTPEATIFALVKEHTGYTPVKGTKIVRGYDSEVYDVATKEGDSFIVKIKHFGQVSYTEEQWALETYRNAGVPVPRTYALGKVLVGEKEREYIVEEKVRGQALADRVATGSQAQINQALRGAGKLLRQIHQVKAGGFDRRHLNGNWDFPDWKSWANAVAIGRSKDRADLLKAGFSSEEIETMLHFLERYRDEFDCEQPVLCQGDFCLEHIFIDEVWHVSAVIDFGEFLGNHPIHDFANFSNDHPALPLEMLIAGYGNHEMFADRFSERLLLHKLGLHMLYLAHEVRQGRKPEVEHDSRELREILGSLTKRF